MKEYWVNVYHNGKVIDYGSAMYAHLEGCFTRPLFGKLVYRIHVKMDGGYNKHKVKGITRPQWMKRNVLKDQNWMA